MSNLAQSSELERLLTLLASIGDMAERRARAGRAPKRPRRLGTSSSRRLRRIRQTQRRVALSTGDGRLDIAIQGRFVAADAVHAAIELIALADDVDSCEDPLARLTELLSSRATR